MPCGDRLTRPISFWRSLVAMLALMASAFAGRAPTDEPLPDDADQACIRPASASAVAGDLAMAALTPVSPSSSALPSTTASPATVVVEPRPAPMLAVPGPRLGSAHGPRAP